MVCGECVLQGAHAGHDVRLLADADAELRVRLTAAREACASGVSDTLRASEAVAAGRAQLAARMEAACASMHAAAAEVKARVDAHCGVLVCEMKRLCASRDKALAEQHDALLTSCAQLRDAVSLCAAVLADGCPPVKLARTLQDVRGMAVAEVSLRRCVLRTCVCILAELVWRCRVRCRAAVHTVSLRRLVAL